MSPDSASSSIDAQLKASKVIADAIIESLTTERGVHAETAVAAAARMAGTFMFRSFGLPTANIAPGSPVFSDIANERGPALVEVMKAGLKGLGIEMEDVQVDMQGSAEHQPQLTLLETQQALEPKLTQIAASHGLAGETAARSCALATATLIYQTRSVLQPAVSIGLATYGFVEGTKTMPGPPPAQTKSKPWYKVW